MPAVPADLSIAARWVMPMTVSGEVLENHAVVVRDGRILDVLPNAQALQRYAVAQTIERPRHVLIPGLVNASIPSAADQSRSAALRCIAQMLRSGTTCFCTAGFYPAEFLSAAVEQGMRALIGIPISASPSSWAGTPDEYLTRALAVRDEFRGHPTVATVFAPQAPTDIGDDLFARVATLANELDAGIVMSLHESPREVEACLARHGLRPVERLHALGLLTPALTAIHMSAAGEADIALSQLSGIGVVLCPESSMRFAHGPPDVAAWSAAGMRLGVGSGTRATGAGLDLWSQLKLLALLSTIPAAQGISLSAWDALAIGTRGGAAALGLDAEIGSIEAAKWADLCCVEADGPMLQICAAADAASRLVFDGSRDAVSDVWIAGRRLLADGNLTRLDWPALTARTGDLR